VNPHLQLLLSPIYDGSLVPEHLEDLRKSTLTDAMILEQFIRSVPPAMIGSLLGFDRPEIRSAMLFPFRAQAGGFMDHVRLKLFPPLTDAHGHGLRYCQPRGSVPRLYFVARCLPQVLEGDAPLWITEGEKKACSVAQLGYPVIGLTGVQLHDLNCGLTGLRRSVIDEVLVEGNVSRFLPVLAHRRGFRVGEVRVRHLRERGKRGFFGIGVYVRRMLDVVALLFLTRFTTKPLRFFGVAGGLSVLAGMAICGYLFLNYLNGWSLQSDLSNRASLLIGVALVVMGVMVFSLGLVAEIIIFTNARNVRDYTLERELPPGLPPEPPAEPRTHAPDAPPAGAPEKPSTTARERREERSDAPGRRGGA